jgi:pimeloyl-ACP methyl ester carboxylesterase
MEKKTVLHLHGFASSGQSIKARYFREKLKTFPQVEFHAIDFNPTPRDFEYMTTTGLINRLRQYVLDHDLGNVSIIGSSYGGLIALHYAHRFGGVEKMLLLAPALTWLSGGISEKELELWKESGAAPVFHNALEKEILVRYDLQADGLRYLEPVPPASPVIIVHGRHDKTVPLEPARAYAADFPDSVRLIEVDADHDLNGHLDFIWGYVQSFLLVPFHATKSPPRPGLILRLAQDKRHRAQLTKACRPDKPSPNGALLAEPGA